MSDSTEGVSNNRKEKKIRIGGFLLTGSDIRDLALLVIGGPIMYGGIATVVINVLSEVFDFSVSTANTFMISGLVFFGIAVWLGIYRVKFVSKQNKAYSRREHIEDSPEYLFLQAHIQSMQENGYFSSYEAKRLEQKIIDSV